MKTSNWMKRFAAIAGSALAGLILAAGANAAGPESVTVDVEYITAITIAATNPLKFGLLDVAMAASESVSIDTLGNVTDAANNVVGGTQAAATLDTSALTGQAITILVDGINDGAFYTLGSFVCDYNADVPGGGPCDGGGLSETSVSGANIEIRVGATLTYFAVASAGTDPGSFDVTMTYQ